MKISRALMVLCIGAVAPMLFVADSRAFTEDEEQLRQMFCAAQGGIDITEEGTVQAGSDVTAVVVCQVPGASTEPPALSASANADVQQSVSCPGFQSICGTLLPSTGSYTVSSSNPVFTTSCAVQVRVVSAGGPAEANGTSSFNCRGYNYANSVLDCSIQWSGPNSFPVGTTSTASVNFNCRAYGSGSFGTAMNYSFQSPRASFSAGPATSSVSVAVQ